MTNYALIYFGGSEPSTPEEGERVTAAWIAWFGKVGPGVVDAGNPFGASASVGEGENAHATGYSIISADSLDAATALLEGHPHLDSGHGARIDVHEIVPMM